MHKELLKIPIVSDFFIVLRAKIVNVPYNYF